MKTSNVLFTIFEFFLLIFFWRNALWWFYNRTGQAVAQDYLFYLALFAVELIAIFMILSHWKSFSLSIIHVICFAWEVVMTIVLFFNNAPFGHYPRCLLWPLLFEVTYLFVIEDVRRVDSIRKSYCLVALLGLYLFLTAMQMTDFENQSNMIYFLVLSIPLLLVTRNIRQRYIILMFVTFMCLLSMKRSMMLSIVLFWGVVGMRYLFSSGKKSMAILLGVMLITIGYYSYNYVEKISGGKLTSRIDLDQKDVTNGREAIYLVTMKMIADSSPLEYVIGHGHNAVKRDSILDISAHNEWMEVLYDYGLIILFLYFCLWIHLIRRWLYHFRNDTIWFIPFSLSLCIFAVMSMVSQLVAYVSYFLYLIMFWSMAEAAVDKSRINNRRKELKQMISRLK